MNLNPQCPIYKAARLNKALFGKIMVAKPPVRASKVGKRNSRALTKSRGGGGGGGGGGFPPATMSMRPGYFQRELKENGTKRTPSCTIPLLLIAYTQKLEILVTALNRASPSPKFQSAKLA